MLCFGLLPLFLAGVVLNIGFAVFAAAKRAFCLFRAGRRAAVVIIADQRAENLDGTLNGNNAVVGKCCALRNGELGALGDIEIHAFADGDIRGCDGFAVNGAFAAVDNNAVCNGVDSAGIGAFDPRAGNGSIAFTRIDRIGVVAGGGIYIAAGNGYISGSGVNADIAFAYGFNTAAVDFDIADGIQCGIVTLCGKGRAVRNAYITVGVNCVGLMAYGFDAAAAHADITIRNGGAVSRRLDFRVVLNVDIEFRGYRAAGIFAGGIGALGFDIAVAFKSNGRAVE